MMAEITWRPGIGDPTWLGWITVVAYVTAALFCVRAGLRTRSNSQSVAKESSLMWFVFATGLFLLGANKQLDLQTGFIRLASQLALNEGWYQQRRQAQIIFVLVLGATMAVIALIVVGKQWHFLKNHVLAVLGSIFLAAFVFLRAAIFNHVDEDVGLGLGAGQWMDGLELAGIFCFFAASVRAVKIYQRNA